MKMTELNVERKRECVCVRENERRKRHKMRKGVQRNRKRERGNKLSRDIKMREKFER
jgi:hypothetical protein